MKRLVIVLLVIFLSSASILTGLPVIQVSAAPPVWSSNMIVETSTGINQQPSALQASDGTIWLAWSHQPPASTRQDIFYKTMTMVGGHFVNSSRTQVTKTSHDTQPALGQLDSNTMILVWASNITLRYQLVYQEFFLNNQTWSSQLNITDARTSLAADTFPSVTVGRDGTLWLFWNRQNTAETQIYYETLKNSVWSSPVKVTSGTFTNWMPSAMMGKDGNIRIAYANGTQGAYQIWTNSFTGTSPGPARHAVTLPTGATMDTRPSLVQDRNGTSWLFWERTTPVLSGYDHKVYTKSDPNYGQNWITDPEVQLTFNHDSFIYIDQQPTAIQSIIDKSLYMFYSTNTRSVGEYDIMAVKALIRPVHDILVTGITTAPNSCLVATTYTCFSLNPLTIYAGGYRNDFAVCPGTVLFSCPMLQSSNVTISVGLRNLGDFNETVSFSLAATNTTNIQLATMQIPVLSGSWPVITVNWNTTGVRPARYGFSVSATIPVESPLNQPDSLLSMTNQIHLLPLGDVDQDGSVTITDISVVFLSYGFSCFDTAHCSQRYITAQYGDVNGNGIIDIVDVGVVLANFGKLS